MLEENRISNVKLRLEGIGKQFPGVKALSDVSFSLRTGTVHAIVGENGAGKSTLMKIISGIHKPDSGKIYIDDQEIHIKDPIDSFSKGIAMIYQELNFFPELSIEENLFMGKFPAAFNSQFINWKLINTKVKEMLKEHNINYDPKMKIKNLSISNIQMLEIVKAVAFKANVIIMDEPTSSISHEDVERLFSTISSLKERGVSIIYISHKMEEIFKIADDITVIRDGSVVSSGPISEYSEYKIIAQMVGRPIENIYPERTEKKIGPPVIEIRNLSSEGYFKDIHLAVRSGEIVGLAGLVGAGRTELASAVFGMLPYDAGEIVLQGKTIKHKRIIDAIKNGILMVSEDRRKYGVINSRSLRENIALAKLRVTKGLFLRLKSEKKETEKIARSLNVKAPNLEVSPGVLSGGNQQKVILSRWLLLDSKVILLDEPTRGIDVGAKLEIYNIMNDLVKEGKGLLMISSELPELIGMCDRIYVMKQGRITGELNRADFSQEQIMKYATTQGGEND